MAAPRDPAFRPRLAALAALAAAAAGLGLAVGSAGGGDEKPEERPDAGRATAEPKPKKGVDRIPLERQVGELLLMSFDETEPPDYIRRRLRREEGAGVIIFSKNAPDPDSAAILTAELQREAGGDALVATDQEGGDIRSVPFAEPESAQPEIDTTDEAEGSARAAAQDLREAGVNVNLAPVADVAADSASVMIGRSYPGDADEVAPLVGAAVTAYGDERVAATAKHFPGLGLATENTDDVGVAIPATADDLRELELPAFQAAIDADVPLVMASHALYPDLDDDRIASQSPAVIEDLLRGELGFDGVVVTDSLEAQAVLDRSTAGEAAVRSVEAGVDLILMTGSGSWNLVYPTLLKKARADPDFRARVRRSAGRVLALKKRLGLKAPEGAG